MKERPILFSAPMVQAILEGRKTQTRRIMKPQPIRVEGGVPWREIPRSLIGVADPAVGIIYQCQYGKRGNQLWVREKFQPIFADGFDHGDYVNYKTGEGYAVSYPATDGVIEFVNSDDEISSACNPSIHMPRWASRIQLEILGVRVQRLQDISAEDAIAEGIECSELVINGVSEGCHYRDYLMNSDDICEWFTNPIYSFKSLWQLIHGKESWDENPWVWAPIFKRIERA